MRKHYTEICSYPWDSLMFDHDGSYGICCGRPLFFGKISSIDDVKNVWNNEDIRHIRNGLLNKEPDEHCLSCSMFKTYFNNEYIGENFNLKGRQGCCRADNVSNLCKEKPKHLQINITNKCNLRCFMCSTNGQNEMDIDLFREIIRCYADGAETVADTITAESFCHSKYEKILDVLLEEGVSNGFTLSNGSFLLSEELWVKYVKTHKTINFSVDASTRETHKSIRGFDISKLFRNIGIINAIRSSKDYSYFKYGFNFLIMRRNVHEMFDFVRKVYEEWGGDFVEMHHIGNSPQEYVLSSESHVMEYNKQLNEIKSKFSDKNITCPEVVL